MAGLYFISGMQPQQLEELFHQFRQLKEAGERRIVAVSMPPGAEISVMRFEDGEMHVSSFQEMFQEGLDEQH